MRPCAVLAVASMACQSAFAGTHALPFVDIPSGFNGMGRISDYLEISDLLVNSDISQFSIPESLDTWEDSDVPERVYIHDLIESVLNADIYGFKELHGGAADSAESDYAMHAETYKKYAISAASDVLAVQEVRIANYIGFSFQIGSGYISRIFRAQSNGFRYAEVNGNPMAEAAQSILVASQYHPDLVVARNKDGMTTLDIQCASRSEGCTTTIHFPKSSFHELVPLLIQRKFVLLLPPVDADGEEEVAVAEDFPSEVNFCRDTWQLISECARESTFRSSPAFEAFRRRVDGSIESELEQAWVREAAVDDTFVRQFNLHTPNVRLVYNVSLGNYVLFFMSTYVSDDDPNFGAIQPVTNYWVDVAKRVDGSLEYVTFLEFGPHFLKEFFEQMAMQSPMLDLINANVAGN